jgi:hypothetical protein
MDRKLSPIEVVARELAQHSTLDESQVVESIKGVLGHLMSRALASLDPDSDDSARFSREYQVVSEVMLFLGTQLIALEDIEEEGPHDRGLSN